MFNKTRNKIIGAVMFALILLLAITLGVIYISSYNSIKSRNRDMLMRYTALYDLDGLPEDNDFKTFMEKPSDELPPKPDEEPPKKPADTDKNLSPFRDERAFNLSTFFSVAFSDTGKVLRIDNGRSGILTDDELVSLAQNLLESGKTEGKSGNLMYMVTQKPNCTLAAFIDNTVTDNSMNTLLRYTVIAGACAIVVLFFVSRALAKKIVRPLEENDERQKQFVSDAGHELKTPIAVISANTDLLSRQIGENEWLSNIKYENERMAVLIKELLDLSHAENAKIPAESVDFSRLVTGETLPFESVAFEKGLIIESDISENIFVEGNPSQLRQLTAILLDNAIRHSKGGEINLTLNKDHRYAVLSVENTADDIPAEKLEHLFERFYRVDEARTDDGSHYGLGLAIAKAIAENSGGNISVLSKDGKVLFTVNLPLQK